MTTRQQKIAELVALLLGEDATPAPARKAPRKARNKATSRTNTFHRDVIAARVPCAYGSASCKSHHFAPNGVGSLQHTTCPKGRAALAKAQKAR